MGGVRRSSATILIRGAGDLATGIAHCLHLSGFRVFMTEMRHPTVVRRTVSFAEAVFEGSCCVEGVTARRADSLTDAEDILARQEIPVLVDPTAAIAGELHPSVLIDAIMAKRNLGTTLSDAPLVIGVGPGFEAGVDVAAVIETQRGHDLARVITRGSAKPNTGIPGDIGGYATQRLLRSPTNGVFVAQTQIAETVSAGQSVGQVAGQPVVAGVAGVVRGLVREGLSVREGQKIGDVDPRGIVSHCFTISDKSRAIAGGALLAVLWLGSESLMCRSSRRPE